MPANRRLAAACATAGLVVAGLVAAPSAAPWSAGGTARTSTQAPAADVPPRLTSHVDHLVAKKRTWVTGWSRTTYRVSTKATTRTWTFTVRATGPRQRELRVQQRVGTSWRTVDVRRTGSGRTRAVAVRITVPQGTTRVRLRLPATRKHRAAVTAPKTFVVARPSSPPADPPITPPVVPPGPSSTHYAFLNHTPIATPEAAPRWDRCTTIRWAADFTRATAGSGLNRASEKARWDSVFAEAAAVSGYRFEYVDLPDGAGTIDGSGGITGLLTGTGGYASAEVVVTYASPDDAGSYRAPKLAGNVIGYGGPASTPSGSGTRIVAGQVVIDYGDVNALMLDGNDLRSLYLHEFGHALGLDHYADTTQVMNPYVTAPAVTAYADGDRAGLAALAGQPCFTGAGLALLSARTLR